MLRALVALLLLANGVFFLWSQGQLALLGWVPQDPREPQRLQRQIQPEQVRLLNGQRPPPATTPPPAAAPTLSETPAPSAPAAPSLPLTQPAAPAGAAELALPTRSCWQASGFTPAQAETLRAALVQLDLPPGSWQLRENRSPARWLVYMGRFDDPVQLERKRAELRALRFDFRNVSTQGLAPGLSLGHYASEQAARLALQNAQREGIRTARVVQEQAESIRFNLRLPIALDTERKAVADLGPALADQSLQACN